MITPELISYIKSQIASGLSQEDISASLSNSGWSLADIQEGFRAISIPTNSPSANLNNPIIAKKSGSFIGKLIIAILVLGLVGMLVSGFFFYQAYSKFANLSNSACSDVNPVKQAECQQAVKGFLGFFMNMAKNQSSNGNVNKTSNPVVNNNLPVKSQEKGDCSTGYTDKSGNPGIGDITDIIGINDPMICYYSQPADLTGISKVVLNSTGSDSKDISRIIYDVASKKTTITDSVGKVSTIEPTSTSSAFGIVDLYMNVLRIQIPLLQTYLKSTNWNTNGNWFSADKVSLLGITVSSNSKAAGNSDKTIMLKLSEVDTISGKIFTFENRSIEGRYFSANEIQVSRDGRLIKSNKSLNLDSYKGGTDFMTNKSIDELINMYKGSSGSGYSDLEFSYER